MVKTDPNDPRTAPQRRTLAYLLIRAAAWLALLALAGVVSLQKIHSFD